ncbi:MAG: CapA family protein [Lachnospiraceae bacterium]|nr:CapA family protein [Lachnospiraceae bacterium]
MKKASNVIAVLLIILSSSLLLWFVISKTGTNKNNYNFNEKDFFDSDVLSETEEIDEQLLDKQLVVDNNKEKFSQKFTSVSEYLKFYNSSYSIDDFAEYIIDNYGLDIFLNICNIGQENLSRDFYLETGKSLFILLDEFIGNTNINHMESKNSEKINFMFAGDICLTEDGFVIDHYETTNVLKDWISESIIERTNNADVFMLNNEFCFSERGTALPGKLYTFRAMPGRIDILKELGTDIVSLANNHVYDYGIEGFSDTLKVLDEAQIKRVGAGMNSSEAENVIYYEINGMKIGIVSASRAEKYRFTPGAKDDSAGIFLMYDMKRILEVIENADSHCDFLISYIHWGTEDSKYYEEYQREIAKQMIDAGTDAIIGGHPHVLQGIEYIDDVPIVYSLGDFWFNYESKYTAMVNLSFDIDGIKELEVIPCLQSDFKTTLITDENSKKVYFDYLRGLSNGCNIDDLGIVTKYK